MKQYVAGYIIDNLNDVFETKSLDQKAAKDLASWLSYFQLNSKTGFENNKIDYSSLPAVLINIIQRGLPTKLNKYALETIVAQSSFLSFTKNENIIELSKKDISDEIKELVLRSLHLIDPRINRTKLRENYQLGLEQLGSDYEENFLFSELPNSIGKDGDFFSQLLVSQRTISNIIKGSIELNKLQTKVRNNFDEQRTDFSIQFPYFSEGKSKGIVIEIDGSQHQSSEQTFLDTERDKVVANSGWANTLRIKTSEFGSNQFTNKIKSILLPAITNEYIKSCYANYRKPIWSTAIGKEVLDVTLIPFGIARIQRTLIEALSHGILKIEAPIWKIAVLERDVPCAHLAVEDLKIIIKALNEITEKPLLLPEIELQVFTTNEFINSKFQNPSAKNINKFNSNEFFDLVIDIAVLDKNIITIASNASEIICVRSVYYPDTTRIIASANSIIYKPFCNNENEGGLWFIDNKKIEKSLIYILQSTFRKNNFRQGQLPIMHNALQCRSVIGLLPTGGGKSLTYQLSALLQPGICLVIDPIRSLMKDQVDGLLRNNIDSCVYINSTLQGEEKRNAMRKLAEGQVQFVFISPERLQMEEFRILLDNMFNNGLCFSYCVIDEAHCVSEWGHDFRTAYLRLGENAIRYCKTKGIDHLPLFGLTATASYDVLADVQRELSGNDEQRRLKEDSIIRSEYTKRNELQYVVEEVTFPTGGLNTIWDLKKELGSKKQERVKRLLHDIPNTISQFLSDPLMIFSKTDFELNEKRENTAFEEMQITEFSSEDFYTKKITKGENIGGFLNAGLIFTPHTKGLFGVTDKFKIDKGGMPVPKVGYFDVLESENEIKAGYFMGSGNDDTVAKVIEEESFGNQDKFINSELNLMLATKAFGMGIDKENIRYTIHINYPGSIESYVQEAGRSGRDRKIALSYILFNDQEVKISDEEKPINHDLDINMYFHKNSFKGVAKELAVLDELLTEIYFPDRTFELENLINNEFDVNVKCNYWEGGQNKRLYINLNFKEPLGYLDLNTLNGFTGGTINTDLSNLIFPLLKNYIQGLNLDEPVHIWMQRSDKQAGIEEILKSKQNDQEFNVTVGFYNNAKERVKTITKWLHDVVHNNFTEIIVQQMRANCTDAGAFIEEVCDRFQKFTHGPELNFEELCDNRDLARGNPKGTAYTMFMSLYNGYRDKMDTEKAIYRLSTLGIIDDYTVNFSSNTFTLKGKKKTGKQYKESMETYLLKYYSEKTTTARLKLLDSIDEPTPLRKSLNFLVNFVYKEIQKKRELAMRDMKEACRIGLEKGSVELKEYIDLYFNSKYARTGYSYYNEKGKEVTASLPDLTDNGKNDDLKLVWRFMKIVEEDPKAGEIDNIKHLRGACTRMLNTQPDSYTILLLNSFTLYMLEFKNPRYLQEAEDLILNAFTSIQDKETDWTDKKLEEVFNSFTTLIIEKNKELATYMEMNGFYFDFDSIMIKRLLKPLQNANSTLHSLNEILN